MKKITVQANINDTIEKVWEYWTQPRHIIHWNFAIPEWQCPKAVNNLQEGSTFSYRMEAKDGSMGFDYVGTFTKIVPKSLIEYSLEDGRKVQITFKDHGGTIKIIETFEPENQNPLEMQQQGWQAILNNFKQYVESH
ncbi:SRPBCC family protein [Aquimarina celericrescens]|uniref:SRPBCC family protein n=1 Tax=Aquimarina celericrescens TaxID=1964542 RepID=A0ABW5AZI9_9FLAO|nr:SRPBCC family protein [Aquimarina celericrescens]